MKNESKYTCKEVGAKFNKRQIAIACCATTDWTESIYQQYKEFESKESMIYYLMDWLDDSAIPEDDREDIFDFIKNANEQQS